LRGLFSAQSLALTPCVPLSQRERGKINIKRGFAPLKLPTKFESNLGYQNILKSISGC